METSGRWTKRERSFARESLLNRKRFAYIYRVTPHRAKTLKRKRKSGRLCRQTSECRCVATCVEGRPSSRPVAPRADRATRTFWYQPHGEAARWSTGSRSRKLAWCAPFCWTSCQFSITRWRTASDLVPHGAPDRTVFPRTGLTERFREYWLASRTEVMRCSHRATSPTSRFVTGRLRRGMTSTLPTTTTSTRSTSRRSSSWSRTGVPRSWRSRLERTREFPHHLRLGPCLQADLCLCLCRRRWTARHGRSCRVEALRPSSGAAR